MITAYIIVVLGSLVFHGTAYLLATETHPRSVMDVAIIVLASALWPFTLLIQLGMFAMFVYEMRRWP
jgi:hypothetical protein